MPPDDSIMACNQGATYTGTATLARDICYCDCSCFYAKQCEPEALPDERAERDWQRLRFDELRRWWAGQCRRILRAFVNLTIAPRVIQQHCWSARRWKSLT